jgi:hypothetical protein
MSKKAESLFQSRLVQILKNEFPKIKIFKIQQTSKRGDPDLLICVEGRFIALELKKDTKSKPTRLQKHILEQVKAAGGFACVCHPDNFKELIENIKEMVSGNNQVKV